MTRREVSVADDDTVLPALTTSDAARLLGVTANTVRRLTMVGDLPCARTPGGQRRFREADVRAVLSRRQSGRRDDASGRAVIWRQVALATLRSARSDLSGDPEFAAPFEAAAVLLDNASFEAHPTPSRTRSTP
ncbi:MAG: helix-turn-helix domain-containing protein [Thermoleophilia bacterium]